MHFVGKHIGKLTKQPEKYAARANAFGAVKDNQKGGDHPATVYPALSIFARITSSDTSCA